MQRAAGRGGAACARAGRPGRGAPRAGGRQPGVEETVARVAADIDFAPMPAAVAAALPDLIDTVELCMGGWASGSGGGCAACWPRCRAVRARAARQPDRPAH